MVDDSMEISSEHEHNNGEEDIDIDIDFTAGQADEDYTLEDAASLVDFGDESRRQSSPVVGNDDLMIDEADGTHMDDTDIIDDEEIQTMELEATATPFAIVDALETPFDKNGASEVLDEADFVGASTTETEVTWENNDAPNEPTIEANPYVQSSGETVDHEVEERLNDLSEKAEAKQAHFSSNSSQVSASQGHLSTDSSTSEHPRNPPVNITDSVHGSLEPLIEKADFGASTASVSDKADEAAINVDVVPSFADESSSISRVPDVIVSYQNTEYALFSTDELDDPDSFFLSDVSVLEKPLAHLFKAIRDVVHEDLTDEDELCMSMGNLNVEIEETSITALDFTLAQILTLHNKLIRNDGVDSPPSFHMQLATRPNFSTRIGHLTTAAEEGKGLSELIVWDEHSDTPFDSTEAAEQIPGEESNSEFHEPEDFVDEAEAQYEKVVESSNIHEGVLFGVDTDTDAIAQSGPGRVSEAPRPTNESADTSVAQQVSPSAIQPSAKAQVADHGGIDEDGDLIDYSDEELDNTEIQGTDFLQASKLQTDDSSTHNAQYETLNEELHRRSISRAAEDSLFGKSSEQTEDIGNGDGVQDDGLEIDAGSENGIQYDGESYGLEDIGSDHEDLSVNGEHTYATKAQIREHDPSFSVNDLLVGYEELDKKDPLSGIPYEPSTEGEIEASVSVSETLEDQHEIELGEDKNSRTQQLPEFSGRDAAFNGIQSNYSGDEKAVGTESASAGSSLGFGNGAASENGTSQKTLEPMASFDDATEDEIGYDEDEDEDGELEIGLQTSNDVNDSIVPLDGIGKRQREDADLDGDTSMRSKDAKRPKS